MAQTQRVQKSIDRTPYAACYAVALIGLVFFVTGAYALTKLGGGVKRVVFTRTAPAIATDAASNAIEEAKQKAQAAVDQIKNDASNAAQDELEKQKAAAAEAAKEAAKAEAQKQLDSFKDSL